MKTIHIRQVGDLWEVRIKGRKKAYRLKLTQQEACQCGRQLAINTRAELVVHRPDGSIRSKDKFPQVDW